jgi:ParB family chromosome partitioning protein
MEPKLIQINPKQIKVLHPRKRYDQKRMDDLTQSVKEQGVMQPIIVRMRHDQNYELMAGSRRLMAAIAAGMGTIPAIVRDVDDGQAIEICVTENLQREDVHELEEADGYRELLELPGYTVTAVAIKVGKDESYVYKRLKLLDLIPDAQTSFLKGEMNAEHAVMIARLQPDEQAKALDALFQNDFGYRDPGEKRARTAGSLKRWIADNVMLKIAEAKFKTADDNLIPGIPSCVNCPKRTGFNRALFNDIKEKDLCTDPVCFAAKTQAHIAKALAWAETSEKPLVRISSFYETKKHEEGDPLPSKNYQVVERKKKCPWMEKAIYTHGDTDLGLQVNICRNPKCPVHGKNIAGHAAESDKWRRQAEKQERERRAKKEIRRKIMAAGLAAIEGPMTRALRELAVIGAWNDLWNEAQKPIATARGWMKEKKKDGFGTDWDAMVRKGIGHMEDIDLDRLLLEITMSKQLEYYPDLGKDRILELADLMRIDHKTIAEAVKKESDSRAMARMEKVIKAKRKQRREEAKAAKKTKSSK